MNITKKLVFTLCLVTASSSMHAIGEGRSVALGAAFGLGYEKLIHNAPAWASIPGVVALLWAQTYAFEYVRSSMEDEISKQAMADVKYNGADDFTNNFNITFGSTLTTAAVARWFEKTEAQKKEDALVEAAMKEAGLE